MWSQCQWETKSTSMPARSTASRSALASQTSPYGPTSKSTVALRSPARAIARAEKPWQATHRWSSVTTMSWPSWLPIEGPSSRKNISATWGTPAVIDDKVSVALSTTTVTVSSSSSTVSTARADAMEPSSYKAERRLHSSG